MKSLVISDIHSNLEALRAVLRHVRRKRIDRVICLGDFVGYGAEPNQVLDRLRAFKGEKTFIRGNHDRVASGNSDGNEFNHAARAAALWTRARLSRPNRKFLASLPVGPLLTSDGLLLCHGSPFDEDEYLFSENDAWNVLQAVDQPVTMFGHTHIPAVFAVDDPETLSIVFVRETATLRLDRGKKYLINPGSVGQPRDRNPQTSFVIWDSDRWIVQFYRIPYALEKTQDTIRRAGLPRVLADRLAYGT